MSPRSLFILSNETVNIWSHLLGFLLFFTLGIYDLTAVLPAAGASREDFVICSVCLFCFQVGAGPGAPVRPPRGGAVGGDLNRGHRWSCDGLNTWNEPGRANRGVHDKPRAVCDSVSGALGVRSG